jgi:hypothetical protein
MPYSFLSRPIRALPTETQFPSWLGRRRKALHHNSRSWYWHWRRRRCVSHQPTILDPVLVLSSPQATIANPLFLVKSRMQAYSPSLPVGTQRHYTSLLHALHSIYREDRAASGACFRGVPTAILRTSMGTSFQMPSYFWMKHQLLSRGFDGFGRRDCEQRVRRRSRSKPILPSRRPRLSPVSPVHNDASRRYHPHPTVCL